MFESRRFLLVQLATYGLFSGPIGFHRLLAYHRSLLYKSLYVFSASLCRSIRLEQGFHGKS
jgi:hypothetical protein